MQVLPAGQRLPVTLSIGSGLLAPPMHQKPASHSAALYVVAPFVQQYRPASQGVHWNESVKPALAPKSRLDKILDKWYPPSNNSLQRKQLE